MSFRWPVKDPDEQLDYSMDWSRFLDTATISSVTWFVNRPEKSMINIWPDTWQGYLFTMISLLISVIIIYFPPAEYQEISAISWALLNLPIVIYKTRFPPKNEHRKRTKKMVSNKKMARKNIIDEQSRNQNVEK